MNARQACCAAHGALFALLGCADPTRGDAALDVTPSRVACVAGDAVRIAATSGGRAASATFTVGGDAAWLDDVSRDRGSATIACRAAGSAVVMVDGAGRRVPVPVVVQPPPAGTLRVTVVPASLALIAGTTAYVEGHVDAARAGVSTELRYVSRDTAVAVVDSLFGLVRATGGGTTTIVAAAHADRTVVAVAAVLVTRSSTLVTAIVPSPAALALRVGDSARVSATVQLARTAPPGTSTAVTFATSDPAIVSVSPDGTVRALGQGDASVFVAPLVAPLLRARVTVSVGVPPP